MALMVEKRPFTDAIRYSGYYLVGSPIIHDFFPGTGYLMHGLDLRVAS
jgi:hypothetical protein